MRRFERIYDVVEPVEEYRAGGYHPVHLEDTFHHRYHVVGKWGFGQSSTVWLAKDTRLQRYVTLKILKANVSSDSQELSILLHLSKASTDCPGRNIVLQLLDHFEHRSPNGLHLCLVFPVMMSDGEAMTVRERPRYSDYVRNISKQLLQGLNFIHDQGLIHGDLQPANILFTLNSNLSSEILTEPELSYIQWLPGIESDNSAPRYLVTSQRPRGMLDDVAFSALTVKIGDMGGDYKLLTVTIALWNIQYNASPVTPVALRAPELLFQHSWNQKIDIWALGCLIFQLTTNEALFPIECFGCSKDEVDRTLRSLIDNLFEGGILQFTSRIREKVPTDFGQEESENLADFLWAMLQEYAEDRKATAELLSHPFIVGLSGAANGESSRYMTHSVR
ncbi:hypothetical protein N7509_007618 [Penicillium cosmopolitanum]|uniref:non-specific serine/threonine protein kinase n=1 Tax=Penicillium cosmopolitanum TaxID=1131564 RepID=A0A9W9VZ91_9EURO|nr:uncharacterized protein N7509_007618 [Penicillium cosmopolitanum]KAJ5392128.1 hypothetical protein N7509_007618 [Penicillium cosmopolitanum]